MAAKSILIVEDEPAIAEAIRARLTSEGHVVDVVRDGREAIEAVARRRPDLVVLDLMLPGVDGLEVCRQIQRDDWVPVMMLTARADEADKVAGLAVGADDYVTKPVSLRELAARVRAIFRRIDRMNQVNAEGPLHRFDLVIDPSRRRVVKGATEVKLTPIEFELLRALARSPGVVFGRERLMEQVWGYSDYVGCRVVDSHIARLRRKLDDKDGYIATVHGVGYAFREEREPREPGSAA